jgi:hypothetical protein
MLGGIINISLFLFLSFFFIREINMNVIPFIAFIKFLLSLIF